MFVVVISIEDMYYLHDVLIGCWVDYFTKRRYFSSSVGSDGILSEATWLLNSGLLPNTNSATRAIGYRQVRPGYLHIIIFLYI